MEVIGNDWDELLNVIWTSNGFKKFMNIVKEKYNESTCYPEYNNIFNALKLTPYSKVKVVILGQDPYHGTGEAHGLSFSVQDGIKKPPSLKNIFKELKDDLNIDEPESGNLTKWAEEGVLLLNSVLTVEKDKAASHKDLGWHLFTDHIIKLLNEKKTPVVFILWGSFARSKKVYITNKKHLIIESTHPSPFSAASGFFGSKPFSKTNNYLIKMGLTPINWDLKRTTR